MAKARITSNAGEGLYGIELEYDSGNLDNQIAALAQQLIDIEQQVLDARVAVIDAEDVRDTLANDLDDAIDAYAAGGESEPVIAATKALAEAVAALNTARFKVQRISGQKLSLAARKTQLENTIVGGQAAASDQVWCADYTDDLATGTMVPVATPPGEISGASWVILPQQHPDGYGGTYDRALHGQLVPRLSMTPAATFYNWAVLPGWQRWMPTHRIGTLTFVDQATDTCNVTLDTARSSADPWPYTQGLSVNLAESTATVLTGVPIRYMTCNAAVFEAGDRVLVRFAQPSKATAGPGAWDEAEVIGFVSNPRACEVYYIAFDMYITGVLSVSGTYTGGPIPAEQTISISADFFATRTISPNGEDQFITNSVADYSSVIVQSGQTGTETPFSNDQKNDFTYSSIVSLPGGATLTLIDFSGHWEQFDFDQNQTWGPSSMTMIVRDINRITATGNIYFATVHHLVQPVQTVVETEGEAAQMSRSYTAYEVVSIDGTEYIISEETENLVLSISEVSVSIRAPAFTFTDYETLNPNASDPNPSYIIDSQMKPRRDWLDFTSPHSSPTFYPSSFNTFAFGLTDEQKEWLQQARNGELPVLSL